MNRAFINVSKNKMTAKTNFVKWVPVCSRKDFSVEDFQGNATRKLYIFKKSHNCYNSCWYYPNGAIVLIHLEELCLV